MGGVREQALAAASSPPSHTAMALHAPHARSLSLVPSGGCSSFEARRSSVLGGSGACRVLTRYRRASPCALPRRHARGPRAGAAVWLQPPRRLSAEWSSPAWAASPLWATTKTPSTSACCIACCTHNQSNAAADSRARSNLLAGKSGISQIERWDPVKLELPTTIAGEIKGACRAALSIAIATQQLSDACPATQTLTQLGG